MYILDKYTYIILILKFLSIKRNIYNKNVPFSLCLTLVNKDHVAFYQLITVYSTFRIIRLIVYIRQLGVSIANGMPQNECYENFYIYIKYHFCMIFLVSIFL